MCTLLYYPYEDMWLIIIAERIIVVFLRNDIPKSFIMERYDWIDDFSHTVRCV